MIAPYQRRLHDADEEEQAGDAEDDSLSEDSATTSEGPNSEKALPFKDYEEAESQASSLLKEKKEWKRARKKSIAVRNQTKKEREGRKPSQAPCQQTEHTTALPPRKEKRPKKWNRDRDDKLHKSIASYSADI